MSQIRVNIPSVVGGGYGDFWRCKKRYRVVKGSRASKKSKTTALNLMARLEQYPQANLLVIRQVGDTLRDSCHADLQWAAARLKILDRWNFTVSPLAATNRYTGQKILFRGLDQAQKTASVTVAKGYLCWVWVEEAFEIEDMEEFDKLDDTIRGELPEGYFHQLTLTFNPWRPSSWLKARFFDDPDSDTFIATTNYKCNEWLSESDLTRFKRMEETNPNRYKVAGLGDWGVEGSVVFEEWRDDVTHYKDRRWTHVIDPFEIPEDWKIYRGFDFGYARPFSVGWYAVDHDDRMYRILRWYGCTKEPNTGLKLTPEEIFKEIYRIEHEHRWLKGKYIYGVADPSIWDASRGISINETAAKNGVYFDPGDNKRLPGLMQIHYRLRFDENGIPMFYVFNTDKDFLRTFPVLTYSEKKAEDIDTDLEDHIYDEFRYVAMARPMNPLPPSPAAPRPYDPLSTDDAEQYDRYDFYRIG